MFEVYGLNVDTKNQKLRLMANRLNSYLGIFKSLESVFFIPSGADTPKGDSFFWRLDLELSRWFLQALRNITFPVPVTLVLFFVPE